MFQLTAPNAICGRVIGRGGSKINSITVCNSRSIKTDIFAPLATRCASYNFRGQSVKIDSLFQVKFLLRSNDLSVISNNLFVYGVFGRNVENFRLNLICDYNSVLLASCNDYSVEILTEVFHFLQEDSGAQITIGKPEPKNPTDRIITIKVQFMAVI